MSYTIYIAGEDVGTSTTVSSGVVVSRAKGFSRLRLTSHLQEGMTWGFQYDWDKLTVSSGGSVYDTALSGCAMNIYGGGIAKETAAIAVKINNQSLNSSLYQAGNVNVHAGGIASGTYIGSECGMIIYSGGTAADISIESGAICQVDGKITGKMSFSDGAKIIIYSNATIDFDISKASPSGSGSSTSSSSSGSYYSVPGVQYVSGPFNFTPVSNWELAAYTLTVSDTQETGTYTLAKNAKEFNKAITILNSSGSEIGTLNLKQTFHIGEKNYTLLHKGSNLVLTIEIPDTIIPTVQNIQITISPSDNQSLLITADYYDDVELASSLYRIGESGTWTDYVDGITVSESATVYFKAVDTAGNESPLVSCNVSIGKGITLSSGQTVSCSTAQIYSGTILSGGTMHVFSGGAPINTQIESGGSMYVYSGGIANTTTVNEYGSMHVFSGGTATDIRENGGYVNIADDADVTFAANTFSGLVLSDYESASVHSGTTANSTTNKEGGRLDVYSGGVANHTEILEGGSMTVFSGGLVDNTMLGFEYSRNDFYYIADLQIDENAIANNTTVTFGGQLDIFGSADNTDVRGGRVDVWSGGTATGIRENGGYVWLDDGATAMFCSNTISGLVLSESESASVHSGTTATDITIFDYGRIKVLSGGITNNLNACADGIIEVHSGGTATGITAENGAYLVFAVAENTCITGSSSGSAFEIKDGLLSDYSIDYGEILVCSGGSARNTEVNQGGFLDVSSGGIADCVTVNSGGYCYICTDGKLTGMMSFAEEAVVQAEDGAILDFDISELTPHASARIDNLSAVQMFSFDYDDDDDGYYDDEETPGALLFTLTVDGTQASGVYSLAEGAADFSDTITVKNILGDELGLISLGETVKIGDADYTLRLTDDTLSVEVVSNAVPVFEGTFFTGDFDGDGYSMLAVQKDSTVTIYQDGAAWGIGLTLDTGWTVVGTGDFNGDGLDDFLRVNDEGYVVGEMSNGEGEFSPQVLNFVNEGWNILGTGDFNGDDADDVLIANPTAASETVGLLGYWKGGTEWTLINGYSAEWECVATGDFDGDGKCDMLWRNSFEGDGGLTYNAYCTWIVDDPVDWRMVSVANPGEWDFLCSGDFDGNGSHDIAMINDAGVVGIWGVNDGYLSSWSILSAVNPSEWTLAGAGDFNADGTDDIAWCNIESGQVGAWIVQDKELSDWKVLAHLA